MSDFHNRLRSERPYATDEEEISESVSETQENLLTEAPNVNMMDRSLENTISEEPRQNTPHIPVSRPREPIRPPPGMSVITRSLSSSLNSVMGTGVPSPISTRSPRFSSPLPTRRSPVQRTPPGFSRRQCHTCHNTSDLLSTKHHICYDCLIHSLVQAKLFYQGFDISRKTEEKMCIVCLEHSKHIGDRYRICMDCLINRLGDLGILNFDETVTLDPLYVALNTESNRDFECIDWQRKKYYNCDICERSEIEGHRKERVCIDCLVDLLIDTNHFVKKTKRTYRRF